MPEASKFAKLDPQAAAYLRQWEQSGAPALQELEPIEARKLVQALPGEPEPIAEIRNLQLPGPAGSIPVRLYRPQSAIGTADLLAPCVIFYHGGGWVVGSINSHDALCRRIANAAECAVASVDYRLAPEHKFPAAVDDSIAVVHELRRISKELGLDADRFAVCGDSAGGNLAAVVAIAMRDAGITLSAQALIYPITNHFYDTESYRLCGEGYFLSRATMGWFWDHYLPNANAGRDWRASPLLAADLNGVAPAWVMTAEFDPLRDEGIAYSQRLREAGVQVSELECLGMIHGFVRRVDQFEQARRVVDWIAAGLRSAFATEAI
jgi:acetyl esterase